MKLETAEQQIAEQQALIDLLSNTEFQDEVTKEMERQYAQLQGDYTLTAEMLSAS